MIDTLAASPSLGARVRLADYPPTPAELRILTRSGPARALRAVLLALLVPPAAVIGFLIPPHGETLFLAVAGGIYLVYREATTKYVVKEFSGLCPRCGARLTLKPGTRLTAARSVPCYGCHFHPTIEIDPVVDAR